MCNWEGCPTAACTGSAASHYVRQPATGQTRRRSTHPARVRAATPVRTKTPLPIMWPRHKRVRAWGPRTCGTTSKAPVRATLRQAPEQYIEGPDHCSRYDSVRLCRRIGYSAPTPVLLRPHPAVSPAVEETLPYLLHGVVTLYAGARAHVLQARRLERPRPETLRELPKVDK